MPHNGSEQTFGLRGRKLVSDACVWDHNAWDNVEWTEEKSEAARQIIASQAAASPHLSSDMEYSDATAAQRWDAFYEHHKRWFFKDRQWLPSEFPELFEAGISLLEVGCGPGNTIFPILRQRKEETELFIHACDFSEQAISLVRQFREFDPGRMHIFCHDLAHDAWFEGMEEGAVDVVVAVFVMSALEPSRLPFALAKIFRVLKPGGLVLFRDYGLYDMTQLRFKPSRLVKPDLYLRGDGTAVHYFSEEEIAQLFQNAGFEVLASYTDRRLVVNRFRKLTMYRIWLQSKFRKPVLI